MSIRFINGYWTIVNAQGQAIISCTSLDRARQLVESTCSN
jgi:hypothetical protein